VRSQRCANVVIGTTSKGRYWNKLF